MTRAVLTAAALAGAVLFAACNPPAAADATGPDCSLDVEVTWDGGTVAWITATTTPGDVAPRFTFQVLGADNASLYYEQVTGQDSATVYPAVDGADVVLVEEGWRPGPLCQRWVYPPEPEPVETPDVAPPAYAPVTPEPGDHRTDTTTPADPAPAGVSRVLHSL